MWYVMLKIWGEVHRFIGHIRCSRFDVHDWMIIDSMVFDTFPNLVHTLLGIGTIKNPSSFDN